MFLLFLIFMDRCPFVGSGFSAGEQLLPHQEKSYLLPDFIRFEYFAWIPSLLVFVVATGVGGKHFVDTPAAPATAAQIFSFGATVAGFVMTWSSVSSDYTAYFHPSVSRFVEFCGGHYQNLISKKLAGEFSYTRISASIFLS